MRTLRIGVAGLVLTGALAGVAYAQTGDTDTGPQPDCTVDNRSVDCDAMLDGATSPTATAAPAPAPASPARAVRARVTFTG